MQILHRWMLCATLSVNALPAAAQTAAPAPDTIAVPAAAEAASETAPAARPGNRFIEEVVVTAQKREENLQDVPISVAAFSADALDARGIVDAKDLPLVTPGMQYGTTSGFSVIFLRGIGTDAFIPSADASIATYVDGVYFPFTHSQAQAFGTVERVEVLKGPQGTLFGRNATGGAISVITKQPSQQFESSVQLGTASDNEWTRRVYLNVPLTDTLAFNLAGIYNSADTYYEHPTRDLPDSITRGVRGKIRWTPNDAFDMTLTGYRMEQDGLDSLITKQVSPKPLLQAVALATLQDISTPKYVSRASQPGFITADTTVLSADAVLSTSAFDIKFIGATQKIETLAATDFDATQLTLVSYTADTYADVETAELQILSNSDSWGADWLNWIGGVYYIHSESGFDPIGLQVGPDLPPPLSTWLPGLANVAIIGVLETESYAGFAQATAKLGEHFSLTLGGRYQTENRKLIRASSNIDLGNGNLQLIPFAGPEADSDNFAPKVVLDYKPVENSMLYLSWSRGYKSGTYNIVSILTPPDYIKPEEVTTIEAGIKTDLFDRSLRFNAALFNNEIKDLQTQVVSLQSGASVAFETAGQARIYGAEFDLSWFPAPDALPGLAVTAGGSYLHGEYTDFKEGSGYDEVTGLFFGPGSLTQLPGRDFTGNKIVRTPEFSGVAGLSYTFDLGNGELEIATDAYYSDGFYYTTQNSPRAQGDNYTVVNARISYLYQPWKLRVTAFGKNINDGYYYLFQYESDFGTSATEAAPHTYGVRINWDF